MESERKNLLTCRGFQPKLGPRTFIAKGAVIAGDVIAGEDCSFWFNSVTRGDVNSIRIGDRVNIQDGAIIHCTYEESETHIADDVSIGHNAVVHGCRIEQGALIGMGAVVMDHTSVGAWSIVAAGAVVLEGTVIEEASIYAGVPARKVKQSTVEAMKARALKTSGNYIMYANWFEEKPC